MRVVLMLGGEQLQVLKAMDVIVEAVKSGAPQVVLAIGEITVMPSLVLADTQPIDTFDVEGADNVKGDGDVEAATALLDVDEG